MINYSIIIPHRNCPDLLDRCIASIPIRCDVEIIIVDDNSQENLKPKVHRQNTKIIYLDSAHSKGAGHARNIGLSNATGCWVLFADADDYYQEGFLEILDDYLNFDIDVLYFGYHYIDGISGVFLDDTIEECSILSNFVDTPYNRAHILFRNYAPWSKMVRRDFILKNKLYFEEVTNGNDILFSLFLASFAQKYEIDGRPIYNYIKQMGGLTNSQLSIEAHMCRIKHYVKLSSFYRSIHHEIWRDSALKYLLYVYKSDGIVKFVKLFIEFLKSIPELILSRKDFVKLTRIEDK